MAQRAHVRVVILSATLVHEDLRGRENARMMEYNQTLKEIAQEESCLFINLYAPFVELIKAYQKHAGPGANLLTVDGVHMNRAGNQLMASIILRGMGVPQRELDAAMAQVQGNGR
jgi:lysophospholipase L1-like esterase